MKTYLKTVTALVAGLVMSPLAHAGFDSGNAGDAIAAEFLYSGRDVLQRLELAAKEGRMIYDTTKLRAVMEKTRVVSKDHVSVKGHEVDAKNYYPDENLIEVGRIRWETYRKESETFARLKLAFHEFLWLTGVDDEGFKVSEPILKALSVPNYSANVWLSLPGTAFAVVECMGRTTDGDYITVKVNTKGAANTPHTAEVEIAKNGDRRSFGYRFGAEDISQFYESDNVAENSAMVGLNALYKKEAPVTIKYTGTNFVDQDLRAVIDSGGPFGRGNEMTVWKGPNYAASQRYVLKQPVCSISSNN